MRHCVDVKLVCLCTPESRVGQLCNNLDLFVDRFNVMNNAFMIFEHVIIMDSELRVSCIPPLLYECVFHDNKPRLSGCQSLIERIKGFFWNYSTWIKLAGGRC